MSNVARSDLPFHGAERTSGFAQSMAHSIVQPLDGQTSDAITYQDVDGAFDNSLRSQHEPVLPPSLSHGW